MKCLTVYYKAIVTALITFFIATSLFAQAAADGTTTTTTDEKQSDVQPSDIGETWRTEDFQPYVKAIEDLKKLSKEYSENLLTQAMDEYSTGMDILRDMDAEIETMNKQFGKQNNLNERWYWQEIDRMNQHKRRIGMLKHSSKLKSVTYFTRAINSLDSVQSEDVRTNEQFIQFQIKLFRAYISTQYDIHNLKPCIPILERYIAINETTKQDVQAYKYLASCYGYMETALRKYNTSLSEEKYMEYKQKKNQALLMATEIQFGIESVQYRRLKDIIELDETKSERLNDYK